MPILPAAVLTGHVVASVARNAVPTVIVILAAVAMGFRPTATIVEWVALAGLIIETARGLLTGTPIGSDA